MYYKKLQRIGLYEHITNSRACLGILKFEIMISSIIVSKITANIYD